jgi:serine/threonine protein kinase
LTLDPDQAWYGQKGPSQMEETRGYQPPEVVFSEEDIPYDLELPSSYDIWSIGVVFLEILFGNSQVFMIQNPQIKAKIDRQFDISSTKHQKEKEKSYFFYALKEFCIVPTKNEPITFSSSSSTSLHLQKQNTRQVDILLDKYAILSRNEKPTNCHFGQFNQTILLRDPFHHGFIKNNPWGLKLLWGLLQWEPTKRLTAKEALEHAFFKGPYICLTTGLKFATLKEFHLHLDYLKALKETKKKKTKVDTTIELPSDFLCPQCHRVFTTMEGCLQHVHGRKHFNNHTIHFCQYEKNQLTLLVKEQTWRYGHLKKIKKKKKKRCVFFYFHFVVWTSIVPRKTFLYGRFTCRVYKSFFSRASISNLCSSRWTSWTYCCTFCTRKFAQLYVKSI